MLSERTMLKNHFSFRLKIDGGMYGNALLPSYPIEPVEYFRYGQRRRNKSRRTGRIAAPTPYYVLVTTITL